LSALFRSSHSRRVLVAPALLAACLLASVAGAPLAGAGPKACRPRSCSADTTRPSVAVTDPAAGATMAGTVAVRGTAADNVSVARVDVSVDGQAAVRATGTTTWSLALDSTRYANGGHTIAATAVDGSGNASSTSVQVTVQNSVTADTQPPTISIASPASGASVSGTVTVTGSAGDDRGLARIELSVDGGATQVASGSTSWSGAVDTRSYPDGTHAVTATAIDTAGNRTSASASVSLSNATTTGQGVVVDDTVLQDPKATNSLTLLGRGRIASAGTREVVLYWEKMTSPSRIVAHVKDTATQTAALIDLPSTAGAWSNPSAVLTSSGDLWILAGSAPVVLRQYRLTGSPLPTSASLISSRTFGDSDSRMGALLQLGSGAIVAVWHQQGATGPQGHGIAYRRVDGSWQEQFQGFTKTSASKDTIVQHPADGSVWLFNNADALGSIAAAHFTEMSGGLQLDWADWSFIDAEQGEFNSDPENPDVVAVADPAAREVVLAYQSAHRLRFSSTVIGSYPAIARLRADRTMTFTHLPVWVSRVSWLGLSVRAGEVWLAHRVVNPNDLSTDNLELRRLAAGVWSESSSLGKATTPLASPAGASFAFNTTDEKLHVAKAR
jgi:hypothetical protein